MLPLSLSTSLSIAFPYSLYPDAHILTLSPSDLFYERRYSHTEMTNPDFVLLAKAMGVHAIRCHNAEELPAKMKEFLEYDNNKPVVMECIVEKNEHVFPMVRFLH